MGKGIMNSIKDQIKRSGSNKGKILYFKPGVKVRIRFLQDMEDGMQILFHDSYQAGINEPCQELFDRECPHHEDEDLRHRDLFCWSVFDYESKEVKLLLFPVNNCSPIPALAGMYDTYGTLMDRDYVITKNGQGTTATFSVVPMDKVKFKNQKAKPYSEDKMLKIIDKAFPSDGGDEEDDDDEDDKKKKFKKSDKKGNKGKARKPIDDDDDDDDDDIDEDDIDDDVDYEELSVKELYKLCKKRDIDVKPKKKASYYIERLEAADNAEYDDDDDDDGDDDEY